MKVLIIGDVHDKIHKVDQLLAAEPADRVIFLGDFFDDWKTNENDARETARRVKEWLQQYECCLGNHDMCYGFAHRNPALYCSGFTVAKAKAIHGVLSPDDWKRFRLHTWVEWQPGDNPWLVTHAGVHPNLVHGVPTRDRRRMIDRHCLNALNALHEDKMHFLLGAGVSRGGWQAMGGLNWLDWSEFKPIPAINQIVGHSYDKTVRRRATAKSTNICIDTALHHYAVMQDGVLEVREFIKEGRKTA